MWVADTQTLGLPSVAFLGTLAGSWIVSRAASTGTPTYVGIAAAGSTCCITTEAPQHAIFRMHYSTITVRRETEDTEGGLSE